MAQAPPQQQPSHARLVAAAVAVLATAMTAEASVKALRALFRSAGIGGAALTAAVTLVMSWIPGLMEGTGPATRWAVRTNDLKRAEFLIAASRRMQAAADAAKSRNEPVRDAVAAALATERRYLAMHAAASDQRVAVASRVDGMAEAHGDLLGWQAVKDARCSPGCRSASGKNFRAGQPPVIEGHPSYPGAVHGATCRCVPVPPFKGAQVLR